MIILGIDPGAEGGIGIIPLYDFHSARAISLSDMTLTDVHLFLQEYRTGEGIFSSEQDRIIDTPVTIFLEEPNLPMFNTHTKNNFSVQAHNKLSRSLGQLEGICVANGYPPILVPPTRWQGFLGCRTGGDKKVSHRVASVVFPSYTKTLKNGTSVSKVTHSTADALLIALYGYLQYATKIPNSVSRYLDTIKPLPTTQPKHNNTSRLIKPTISTQPKTFPTKAQTVPTITRKK